METGSTTAARDQLHAVAPSLLPTHRAQLDEVVSALNGSAGGAAWADIDLYEAFDPRTCVVERTNWARTVSVYVLFVPLLMTWVGLWLAVDAYNALPETQRETRSFFEVWVAGAPSPQFGITASLSELAMGVAIVFLVAIASGMLAERHDARTEAVRDAFRSALTSASIELRRVYPRSTAEATAAVRDLRDAVAGTTGDLVSLTAGLDAAVNGILEHVDARARASVDALASITSGAVRSQTDAVAQIEQALARSTAALQYAASAAQDLARATELDRVRREEYDRVVSHLADTSARLREAAERAPIADLQPAGVD